MKPIIKYLRKGRVPYGCITAQYAETPEKEKFIIMGWSLCNKNYDEFNKQLGRAKAFGRGLTSFTKIEMEIPASIEREFKIVMEKAIHRFNCCRFSNSYVVYKEVKTIESHPIEVTY